MVWKKNGGCKLTGEKQERRMVKRKEKLQCTKKDMRGKNTIKERREQKKVYSSYRKENEQQKAVGKENEYK